MTASQIASIALNDGGTPVLTVTAATLVADAGALAAITGSYTLTVSSGTVNEAQIAALSPSVTAHLSAGLAVSDSAAAIGGALSTLLGLGTAVGPISLTDETPVLSLTAAQVVSDASVLLKIGGAYGITLSGTTTAAQATGANSLLTAHLTSGFAVLDSAANVVSHLDGLQGLVTASQLGSIALNDGGTPAVTVTAATLVADAGALAAITGGYTLTVSSGTVTEAQIAALSPSVTAYLSAGLAVSDSAGTITGALSTLLGLGSAVGSIALTDGTPVLSLTAAQLVSASSVLLKIGGAYGITLSGTATAAQATGANSVLTAHLTSGFAVLDSAAGVTAHLDGLQVLATANHLGSIALNDGGTPVATVTAATLVADAGALAAITGSYTLTVASGTVTEAQIAALSPSVTAHLSAGLAVSDSAATIGSALSTLLGLGSTVGSITLTDGTPVLSLTGAQLLSDASVLLKIGGGYGITLSGTATAAQATGANSLLVAHLTSGFAVLDSLADITSHLDGLQALSSASQLGSIALNDGGTPTLTVTAATLVADAGALAAINGGYTITVSSGTVTEAQIAVMSPSLTAHLSSGLAVSDSAATVTGALSTLLALGSTVGSITLTDDTPVLSLTAAQLVSDASVLLKISGAYGITLSGTATAAQATGANSLLMAHLTAGFAVLDSAANVASHLDGLQGLVSGSQLGSIALNDGGTPTVTVTAATLVADAGALAAITGGYTLTVLSGTVTEAQIAALSPSIAAHLSAGLAVSDSAATIGGALGTLLGLGSTVGSIALTGGTPVVSLTAAQLVSDASVLLKIGGGYAITLSGTATAAQAAGANSLLTAHLTSGFAVLDSVANVTSHLDALQTLAAASKLGSIALNDGGTPTLTVTAAMLVADAGALAAITGSYTLTVSSGTVTEAQIAALSPSLTAHLSAGLAVSDIAANVSGGLDTLQALGSTDASIAITGSPATFAVTATQLWHDAGALGKIITGGTALVADGVTTSLASAAAHLGSAPTYTGALVFEDLAANVTANLASLQALATAGHLGTILLSDASTPTISITTTQLLSDAGALAEIGSAYNLSIASGTLTAAQIIGVSPSILAHATGTLPVRDSSANIVTNLDALQTIVTSIGSVVFSNANPTLSLTATKLINDAGVLALAGSFNVSISGTFTAAQAATLSTTSLASHLLTGAVVSDTAAHVSNVMSSLQTLANAGKLGPITLNGGTVLTVTPEQLMDDSSVIRKISSYTLALTGPLTADQAVGVNSLLVSKLPSNLAVSDLAANVLADLDELEVMAAAGHLGSVTLTDIGTPVLQVSADQLTSDASVLGIITGTYQVQISGGITANQAVFYASHLSQLGGAVDVVDSAANIQAALGSLQTINAQSLLNSISFTDAGTPNLALTTTAFAADAGALAGIIGAYTVTLTGTLMVAQVEAAVADGLLAFVSGSVAISDTASAVQGGLDALQALGSAIGSIALTDETPIITITATTLIADEGRFGGSSPAVTPSLFLLAR